MKIFLILSFALAIFTSIAYLLQLVKVIIAGQRIVNTHSVLLVFVWTLFYALTLYK